jgi:predicted hydrocarbon binding protein
MIDLPMNRTQFLANAARFCSGSCFCCAMGGVNILSAQQAPESETGQTAQKSRSETRINFAEKWLTRFFDVLDSNLDEDSRKEIMMANGKACFLNWRKEIGQPVRQTTLKKFTEWVKNNVKDDTYRVEGNVIYFQFTSAAETGLPSEEGACLCPLVETKPEGLSPTYCQCSVGYVKEWYDQLFGKSVQVELLDSVLMGGKRCRFRITV